MRISYSNISDIETKTKYSKNIVNPNPLFMRHLKNAILRITNNSIQNSIVMLHTIPTELTFTGAPYIIPYKSQGTGSLKKYHSLITKYFCQFFVLNVDNYLKNS